MSDTVYSYSRLEAFNNCRYEFYRTYVLKERGENGMYGLVGGATHEIQEQLQPKLKDNEWGIKEFHKKIDEYTMMGADFPSEKIRESYISAVEDFIFWFKPINAIENIIEEEFFEDIDGVKMRGFIDLIIKVGNGQYVLLDWKTSSMSGFTGKGKVKKGRQLALYAWGIKKKYGEYPIKCGFVMMKFAMVKHKNARRPKRIERNKFVETYTDELIEQMLSLRYNNAEISILLSGAKSMKDVYEIDPKILDVFEHKMYVLEHNVDEQVIAEAKKYVVETVTEIESLDTNDESDYPPRKITKFDSFFCNVLCNHRKTCPYIQKFNNEEDFTKSIETKIPAPDNFEDLFK